MHLSIHNRTLLRGLVAGAVALAGASACSRSDRADTGRDTTQTGAVAPADTQPSATAPANAATQPAAGAQPSLSDTATGASTSETGNAASETATSRSRIRPSRSAATDQDSAKVNDAESVSGYQAMGHDPSVAPGNATDSAEVSAAGASVSDTSANAGAPTGTEMGGAAAQDSNLAVASEVTADTANSGYAPMARDTSLTLAQGDTTVEAQVDTSSQAQADTATIGDTAVILTQADTTQQTEVAVGNETDTTAMANDSAAGQPIERVHPDTVSQKAEELTKHEPARVRPPEDSTATLGDAAAVGAAGVASTGDIATGAQAVDLMSRGGQRCTVVVPDESRDVLWDMASSPASLNPCGTGTMTLPKIWTGEKK